MRWSLTSFVCWWMSFGLFLSQPSGSLSFCLFAYKTRSQPPDFVPDLYDFFVFLLFWVLFFFLGGGVEGAEGGGLMGAVFSFAKCSQSYSGCSGTVEKSDCGDPVW